MPTRDSPILIERFDPSRHQRGGFDCGVARLNNFLRLSARKQQADDMTRVYVAVEPGNSAILGYHAINAGVMDVSAMARSPHGTLRHGAVPVLFLGQVAVALGTQGLGIGSLLMHHVFEKARVISDKIGCYARLLDVMPDGGKAATEQGKTWYRGFGFQEFPSNASRMFMTMRQIRDLTDE